MDEFVLVLTGGAISLVSSATVTWVQGYRSGRSRDRAVARESARQLTSLFIAARDVPGGISGSEGVATLAEAEVVVIGISDRAIRDRVQGVLRLLRECHLREVEELSGVKAERARRLLGDHALEVLGAYFRGDRTPALPAPLRKMLDVEDEALGIHSGAVAKPVVRTAASPESADAGEPPASRKVRQRPKATGGERTGQ